jgi:hypothetical protein
MSEKHRETIFTDIFVGKKWGSEETVSGEGSPLRNTSSLRETLPILLKSLGVRTIADAPCGDYNWLRNCPLDLDSYLGVDIVEGLVEGNQRAYGDTNHQFTRADICEDILPKVDLILCRDCLIHLSNEDSLRAIRNFVKSGSTYLLITTNPKNPWNFEIETGGFRHCNMTKIPFNFPEPISLLPEHHPDNHADYDDKSLGLWRLVDIEPMICQRNLIDGSESVGGQ